MEVVTQTTDQDYCSILHIELLSIESHPGYKSGSTSGKRLVVPIRGATSTHPTPAWSFAKWHPIKLSRNPTWGVPAIPGKAGVDCGIPDKWQRMQGSKDSDAVFKPVEYFESKKGSWPVWKPPLGKSVWNPESGKPPGSVRCLQFRPSKPEHLCYVTTSPIAKTLALVSKNPPSRTPQFLLSIALDLPALLSCS